MADAKLSPTQKTVLNKMRDGKPHTAYRTGSLATLEALHKRGLVSKRAGLGAMAFPHTSIEWTITDAGRAL
jgi:hypothetical protein